MLTKVLCQKLLADFAEANRSFPLETPDFDVSDLKNLKISACLENIISKWLNLAITLFLITAFSHIGCL